MGYALLRGGIIMLKFYASKSNIRFDINVYVSNPTI